jgi:hypothetical protein
VLCLAKIALVESRFKRYLLRRHFVRLHMIIIVLATMAAGLVASKLLSLAGMTSVEVRYPLAAIIAYFSFLGFIRLWIGPVRLPRERRRNRGSSGLDWLDLPDLDVPGLDGAEVTFGGGDSGGGGASDAWDAHPLASPPPGGGASSSPANETGDGGWNSIPDIDELGVWVLFGALIVVSLGAGVYLVYLAPAIMPEVAFNAIVASSFAATPKRGQSRGWILRLFRHTRLPLAAVLTMTIALGTGVHRYCPSATKLADTRGCPARSSR